MLHISLNYTQWPIFGNSASQLMSLKLKYLCLSYRKHLDLAHLGRTAGEKKESPESPQNEDLTPRPHSLLAEKPEFYLREDGLEGPLVHHPQSAGFPDKVAILCSATFLSIYCPVMPSISPP